MYTVATHGIFAGDAVAVLEASAIKKVIVTNTIPFATAPSHPKFVQLSIAQILADAINRITANRSVSELFTGDEPPETLSSLRPEAGRGRLAPSFIKEAVATKELKLAVERATETRHDRFPRAARGRKDPGRALRARRRARARRGRRARLRGAAASRRRNAIITLTDGARKAADRARARGAAHPVSRRIVHADLQRVSADETINARLADRYRRRRRGRHAMPAA